MAKARAMRRARQRTTLRVTGPVFSILSYLLRDGTSCVPLHRRLHVGDRPGRAVPRRRQGGRVGEGGAIRGRRGVIVAGRRVVGRRGVAAPAAAAVGRVRRVGRVRAVGRLPREDEGSGWRCRGGGRSGRATWFVGADVPAGGILDSGDVLTNGEGERLRLASPSSSSSPFVRSPSPAASRPTAARSRGSRLPRARRA